EDIDLDAVRQPELLRGRQARDGQRAVAQRRSDGQQSAKGHLSRHDGLLLAAEDKSCSRTAVPRRVPSTRRRGRNLPTLARLCGRKIVDEVTGRGLCELV